MHRQHLKIQYFLKSEMNELYMTHSLRSFAMSTIAVFLPIFLLKKDYSLFEVLLYQSVYVIAGAFFMYLGLKYSAKKGAKHSITLSMPFMILFFLMLYNIDFLINFIGRITTMFVISLVGIFSSGMYFAGFHVDFAKLTESKKSAKQVSIVQSMSIIFSIIGPLFGALIITTFSFQVLFSFIILILFVSIIPLFFSSEVSEPFEFKLKNSFTKREFKRNWVFFAEGMRDYAARIFWPLLLYFLLINLKSIGGIFTISNAILALFTIYIGRKLHSHNKKKIMKWGAIIHAISLSVRTFLKTMSLIAIVQGFGAMSFTMVNVPFHSVFYNNSKKKGISNTIFSREIFLHSGRFGMVALLAILLLFLPVKVALISSIIIGALFTFLMIKIEEEE